MHIGPVSPLSGAIAGTARSHDSPRPRMPFAPGFAPTHASRHNGGSLPSPAALMTATAPSPAPRLLGDLLLARGAIGAADLARALDLQARVDLLRHGLNGIAAQGRLDLRTAAAVKVTAARLGEEVVSECMHIFGGSGYLVDETPLGRWWRDMKLARVGGGTDEVLWELVAAGMRPDYDGYDELFASGSSSG